MFFQLEQAKRLEKEKQKEKKAKEQVIFHFNPLQEHWLNIKDFEHIQADKDAKNRVPPEEMFRSETDKYSQFDDKVGHQTPT